MNVGPALPIVVVAIAYALAARSVHARHRPPAWRVVAFLAGLGTLGLGLAGPLDALAHALFWAHMVQHMVLTIVVPPLLALGQPLHLALMAVSPARRRIVGRWLARPSWVGVLLDLGAHPLVLALTLNMPLIIWHLPAAYEAALSNQLLHDVEHLSFLGPACILWLVMLEPTVPRRSRPTAEGTLLVLFLTWMICDLLGATLALSGTAWYPSYAASAPAWGVSAIEDQRLGGLVMWIGGGVFYGVVMLATFVRLSGVIPPRVRSLSKP